MLAWTNRWFRPDDGPSPAQVVETFADMVLDALATAPGPSS